MRLLVFFALLCLTFNLQAQTVSIDKSWQDIFAKNGISGTIVVYDSQSDTYFSSDTARFKQRFIPASTFKIPHTLFALDAGVVTRNRENFKWDGKKQKFGSWEQDQTLSTAFRNSVPWVYQRLATHLGDDAEKRYLQITGYGNSSIGGGIENFWLTGDLAISAYEQIGFLRKLESDSLPFNVADQLFVKDLMLVEVNPAIVIRAKSGWAFDKSPQIGWYVGWAEIGTRRIFFALNVTITQGEKQLPLRSQIAREVVRRVGGA